MPTKVHRLVVFSRFRADGQRYASYSTLWIVTQVDGQWGVQVTFDVRSHPFACSIMVVGRIPG
jgi:hypothetical protein